MSLAARIAPFRGYLGPAALMAVGFGSFTLHGWLPMNLAAEAAFVAGALWAMAVWAAGAPRGSEARTRRLKILVSGGTSLVLLAVVVNIVFRVHMGPSRELREQNARAAAVRGVPREQLDASRSDPVLGWAPTESADYVGQRLDRVDHDREQILFVGDSILYGAGVEDHEIVSYQLGQKVANYQVVNASVSGYSIDQYHLMLQRVLPIMKAKLAFVGVFAGNDYQLTGREWGYGHDKPLFVVENGRLVRADENGACVNGLAQSMAFRLLWLRRDFALSMIERICRPRELKRFELEAVIAKLFDGMEETAKAHGTKLVFLLMPVREDYDYELTRHGAEDRLKFTSKYDDLKRLLQAGGHEVFEPYLPLSRAVNGKVADLYRDPGHYTPRGHALLADILLRYVRERNLLDLQTK